MRSVRDERGMTLVEVLLVCVVGMIIFSATLAAFTSFYSANRAAEQQSDNVEDARMALDTAARQLRNLANPSAQYPTIFRASGNDFIFQTSDPAKTWVRYCLDTSGGSTQAKLWMAESSSSLLPDGMKTGCPGTGASRITVVSQNVSNARGGLDRPVFTYACLSGSPTSCPASDTDDPKITMVGAQLFIDTDPNDHVHEQNVATAVYLRNQNQAPTATVTGPVRLGTYKYMLNASGSSDPEGRTLDFHWYLDSEPPSGFDCASPTPDVWSGPTYTNDFGAGQVNTIHKLWLVVCDPGGMFDKKGPFPITVTPPS